MKTNTPLNLTEQHRALARIRRAGLIRMCKRTLHADLTDAELGGSPAMLAAFNDLSADEYLALAAL